MPWTWQRYPDSMKNLPVRIRHKAIEVANALLEDGYEESRAIPIAIAQAKEWHENHPPRKRKPADSSNGNGAGKRSSQKRETTAGSTR
jgi:uncharacterized protein YdaT